MVKHYKIIKENFLWEVGGIVSAGNDGHYLPISDFFKKHENIDEYISSEIIENSSDYFQRVYPVNLLTKTVYKIREEAKELLERAYKD